MSVETQINVLKTLLSSKPENELPTCEELIAEIKENGSLTPIEKNIIIRCAEYDILPRKRLSNQTEVNRYVYSTSKKLEQDHGIEKKHALQVVGGIASAYSSFDAQLTLEAPPKPMGIKLGSGIVSTTSQKTNTVPTMVSSSNEQKEKKGLFSFLKKK